ncbi:MAG: hypothetical protein QM820_53070 [Minicystis sp.]
MPTSSEMRATSPRPVLRASCRTAAWVIAAALIPGGALAQAPAAPLQAAAPPQPAASPSSARWTATTPDEMVDHLFARARRGGDDALAALVVASSIEDRASFGKVREGLASIASSGSPFADDARWLRLRLLPSPSGRPWPGMRAVSYDAPPDHEGLVKSFAILGPFQDTGGGLMRREGPEAPGESWTNATARYAWGVYDVAWRRVLPASATARGVPLDLYIHPRNESCTYLASKVTVPASAKPMLVHLASTGAVRLIWDGADVAASDEVRAQLVLDRISARIEPKPGDHLLAVKVCSAAVGDEGRVRLRFTDEQRKPLALATSSDLRGLSLAPSAPPADSPEPAPAKKPAAKPAPAAKKAPPAKAPPAKAPAAKAPAAKAPPAPAKKGKPAPEAPVAEAPATTILPPKGITILPSTLDKALDIGDSPSPERALAAAILRTTGGADDARSPRAPGLLDRVARAPETTPDQLAMAGWISPFGANRSGWLNLARSRAAAAHDPATAAFAQRRLVAAHLTSRYVDWAISTAGEEPLASATDPEAALIRVLVKKQLGAQGFGRAALEDLYAIDAKQGSKTPIGIVAETFGLSRSQGEQHLNLGKRLAQIQADSRGSGFVSAFRVEGPEAVERAAAESLAQQTSVDDIVRIGQQLMNAGRWSWAREVFYTATQLSPNKSAGFVGLAAARSGLLAAEQREGKPPSEDPALVKATLTRAHDLEPGDVGLKAELGLPRRRRRAFGRRPRPHRGARRGVSDEARGLPRQGPGEPGEEG